MTNNYMGIDHLLKSIQETMLTTNTILKGIRDNYPKIVDILFKLPYFIGELEPVDTDIGDFQWFCSNTYIQIPYTAWTVYDLYQQGFYYEAAILHRNLLEVFISLKYFNKYPQKLVNHLKGVKRQTFKNMFMEFKLEEFYQIVYGKLLSSFAHGTLAKDIFRYDDPTSKGRTVIMGCEYNEDWATFLMNQTIPILLGYLKYFHIFFPNNTLNDNHSVNNRFKEIVEWIECYFSDLIKTYPEKIKYYENMGKIINPH